MYIASSQIKEIWIESVSSSLSLVPDFSPKIQPFTVSLLPNPPLPSTDLLLPAFLDGAWLGQPPPLLVGYRL